MLDLSDTLGWVSIGCWLGAQFPQVVENYQRQSADGLALPFLANWLFGDITNLLGCILTKQLPFQTYLAGYFVFVDFSLLSQYLYYTRLNPPSKPYASYVHDRTVAFLMNAKHPRYRTLSHVAANVAAAAALAAQQESRATSPHHRRTRSRTTGDYLNRGRSNSRVSEEADEVDEQALATLADSFHSERGTRARKHVSWSRERRGGRGGSLGRTRHLVSPLSPNIPPEELPETLVNRGRSTQRAEEEEADVLTNRRNSRAGRQGASLVFLGVWALFGISHWSGMKRDPAISPSATRTGHVVAASEVPVASPPILAQPPDAVDITTPILVSFANPYDESMPRWHGEAHDEVPPSTERVIGRIFAWVCTTLYLTSRLPQIWKNWVRKSAEGLSVYLFIFAFLGNFFYVASILTSPNLGKPAPEAAAFLKESIPYLLGSGGTLMFDVTIVTQTIIYRPRRPRRASVSTKPHAATASEEEAGLLSGDALAESVESLSRPRRTTSSAGTRAAG